MAVFEYENPNKCDCRLLKCKICNPDPGFTEWDACKKKVELNKKLTRLYHAANELMSRLGADGEINAHQDESCAVMSALKNIDGGVYDNDFIVR